MISHLTENLELLKKHQPSTYEAIEKQFASGLDEDAAVFTQAKNGAPNLLVRLNGQSYPIHDMSDPQREAREAVEKTNLEYPSILVVLGLGLGYIIEALEKKLTDLTKHIIIVEKEPLVFKRALECSDFGNLIRSPRVVFMIGLKDAELYRAFYGFIRVTERNILLNNFKMITSPTLTKLYDDYYYAAIKEFLRAKDFTFVASGNSPHDSFWGFKNTMENIDILMKWPSLGLLRNRFKDKPAILISAGPSLDKQLPLLRECASSAVTVCVDTALKPLLDKGIIPNFTCALERSEIVTNFFKAVDNVDGRTYLIGPPLLLPESFQAFKGRGFLYYTPYPYYSWLPIRKDVMATGSSAGNLALSICATLGCNPIIIIGQNFAFDTDTGRSHMAGTIDPNREQPHTREQLMRAGAYEIEGYYGKPVLTDFLWDMFLSQYETLIAALSVTVINSTEGGARIRGAQAIPFREAVSTHLKDPLDTASKIATLYQEPSREEKQTLLKTLLTRIEEAIAFYTPLAPQCQQMHQQLEETLRFIEDREASKNPLDLKSLNKEIDTLLTLKKELVTSQNDHVRILVCICSPYQVAFERIINELPFIIKTDYLLKTEYLKRHKPYFSFYASWIEKICAQLEKAKAATERLLKEIHE